MISFPHIHPEVYYRKDGKLCLVKGNSSGEENVIGRRRDISKFGYEPYSEVLVSILLDILEIDHVKYWIDDARNYPEVILFGDVKHVSVCESYLKDDMVSTQPFYQYLSDKALESGKRVGADSWGAVQRLLPNVTKDIYLMLHVDAIVGNADRHLNNWDIIQFIDNSRRRGPLLDFGAALLSLEKIPSKNDKAKPFKDTHQQQVRLISRYYKRKLNTVNVFEKWLLRSEYILELLPKERAEAVADYLKLRLERYREV